MVYAVFPYTKVLDNSIVPDATWAAAPMPWTGTNNVRAEITSRKRLGAIRLAPPSRRSLLMRNMRVASSLRQKESFPICSSLVWADARASFGFTAPVHAVFSALASMVDAWSQRGKPTRVVIAFAFQTWLVRLATPKEVVPILLATSGEVMTDALVGK